MYRKNTCLVYLAASCSEDLVAVYCQANKQCPIGIIDRRQLVFVKFLLLPLVMHLMLRGIEFRHVQAPSQQGARPAVGLMPRNLVSHVGGDYLDGLSNLVSTVATDEFCGLDKLLDRFP